MKNRKEIFKRAWRMAKNAAAKFGGNSSEFFRECLKLAWKGESTDKRQDDTITVYHRFYQNNRNDCVRVVIEHMGDIFQPCIEGCTGTSPGCLQWSKNLTLAKKSVWRFFSEANQDFQPVSAWELR